MHLGRAIDQPSVDNASRREPPLVTASRTGLMEAATLLLTHGASTEARDGQGRTALWHAVREEQDGIVEMLIHAGARVFHENEDLSCPTQLACKTALLKVKRSLEDDHFSFMLMHVLLIESRPPDGEAANMPRCQSRVCRPCIKKRPLLVSL